MTTEFICPNCLNTTDCFRGDCWMLHLCPSCSEHVQKMDHDEELFEDLPDDD